MPCFAHILLYGSLFLFQIVIEPLIEFLSQILLFRQAQRLSSAAAVQCSQKSPSYLAVCFSAWLAAKDLCSFPVFPDSQFFTMPECRLSLCSDFFYILIQYLRFCTLSNGSSVLFSRIPPHFSITFCDPGLSISQVISTFLIPSDKHTGSDCLSISDAYPFCLYSGTTP